MKCFQIKFLKKLPKFLKLNLHNVIFNINKKNISYNMIPTHEGISN